ncbi:MAG: CbtA family protein, partial [Proteobacteria bacterium]|nr:CbtA family protein [Pseudomonadota bacterium]
LPGMAGEADLIARQTWAISTTLVTILGLAMIGLARHWGFKIAGAVAIALPHIVGLQGRVHVEHAVPADLVAEFVVATLVITALFWALLGGLTSYFSGRYAQESSGA